MKIKVIGYPKTFSFETNVELPPFKYGCSIRTKIVRRELKKIIYDAPHAPSDFVVEVVKKTKDGEIWDLGS